MCLGEGIVELERLARIGLGAGEAFRDGDAAVVELQRIRVGETGVGRCVAAIGLDGLLEQPDRLGDAFLGAFVPGIAAFQVQAVGLEVLGVALGRGLVEVGKRGRAQRVHDGVGDLVLDREDVGEGAVVALGPEQAAVLGGAELRRNPQPVSGTAHRPLKHPGRPEQGTDGADVLRLAFEGKGRSARGHPQSFDLGQRVDQLVGDSIAQVFGVGVGAGVDEGQHHDAAPDRRPRG